LYGYEGVNCDKKSESLQTQKTIVSIASILAFIILGLFCCLIFFMDYLKYFVIKNAKYPLNKKGWKIAKNIKNPKKFKKIQKDRKADGKRRALEEPSRFEIRNNRDKIDKSLGKFRALKEELSKSIVT